MNGRRADGETTRFVWLGIYLGVGGVMAGLGFAAAAPMLVMLRDQRRHVRRRLWPVAPTTPS